MGPRTEEKLPEAAGEPETVEQLNSASVPLRPPAVNEGTKAEELPVGVMEPLGDVRLAVPERGSPVLDRPIGEVALVSSVEVPETAVPVLLPGGAYPLAPNAP